MKHISKLTAILCGILLPVCPATAKVHEQFTVNGKADIVSDYIWRGADQNSGCSVQPSLTLGYAGFSLNVWGSQSLTKWNDGGAKEFDLNLGYTFKNFTITISDYWWSGVNRPYGDYKNAHYFEGALAYQFGASFPLAISWSTMFAGADKDRNGKQNASTYISVSYPIALPADITLLPSAGFTPWKGYYHDKTACTDISLKASKDISFTDKFDMPLYIQAIVSPVYDRTYLIAGLSIGF